MADQHESEPTQASLPCPSEIAPTDSFAVIAPVPMPARPLILDASEVSLPLTAPDDRSTAQRLAAISQSEVESVLLQVKCVEADRPPGALWEVYVGLPANAEPNAESPHFVGNIALLRDGIRSESTDNSFAEFVFVLDRAIAASSRASPLTVIFVPSSGIVADGRPTPAEVAAPVRIGELNLLLEGAQPSPHQ